MSLAQPAGPHTAGEPDPRNVRRGLDFRSAGGRAETRMAGRDHRRTGE